MTSFDGVAKLVVCEEKGTQVDLGVGLKPSFSRKLMALWCFFVQAAPRTTAKGRPRTIRNEIRHSLSTGENTMGITQDAMNFIEETPLFRGLLLKKTLIQMGL